MKLLWGELDELIQMLHNRDKSTREIHEKYQYETTQLSSNI